MRAQGKNLPFEEAREAPRRVVGWRRGECSSLLDSHGRQIKDGSSQPFPARGCVWGHPGLLPRVPLLEVHKGRALPALRAPGGWHAFAVPLILLGQ